MKISALAVASILVPAVSGLLLASLEGEVGKVAAGKIAAGKVIVNSVGIKLASVPAGTFTMGSPAAEEERSPSQEGECHDDHHDGNEEHHARPSAGLSANWPSAAKPRSRNRDPGCRR